MRSTRPMIISWLRLSKTLYQSLCWWETPLESGIDVSNKTASCTERWRVSPMRTTLSIARVVTRWTSGRRLNKAFDIKILPWAPVSRSPRSKDIGSVEVGVRMMPDRMKGLWSSASCASQLIQECFWNDVIRIKNCRSRTRNWRYWGGMILLTYEVQRGPRISLFQERSRCWRCGTRRTSVGCTRPICTRLSERWWLRA